MAQESRAEYFRERRKARKQFSVLVDRKKVEELEEILISQKKSKAEWLLEKIDEELGK